MVSVVGTPTPLCPARRGNFETPSSSKKDYLNLERNELQKRPSQLRNPKDGDAGEPPGYGRPNSLLLSKYRNLENNRNETGGLGSTIARKTSGAAEFSKFHPPVSERGDFGIPFPPTADSRNLERDDH